MQAEDLCREVASYVNAVMVCLPPSDTHLDEIRQALKEDEILKVVMHHVEHGWPEARRALSGPLVKYWTER